MGNIFGLPLLCTNWFRPVTPDENRGVSTVRYLRSDGSSRTSISTNRSTLTPMPMSVSTYRRLFGPLGFSVMVERTPEEGHGGSDR